MSALFFSLSWRGSRVLSPRSQKEGWSFPQGEPLAYLLSSASSFIKCRCRTVLRLPHRLELKSKWHARSHFCKVHLQYKLKARVEWVGDLSSSIRAQAWDAVHFGQVQGQAPALWLGAILWRNWDETPQTLYTHWSCSPDTIWLYPPPPSSHSVWKMRRNKNEEKKNCKWKILLPRSYHGCIFWLLDITILNFAITLLELTLTSCVVFLKLHSGTPRWLSW